MVECSIEPMNMNWFVITICVGVALMTIELLLGVATGFDLFLIGLIFLVSGGVGYLFNSFYVLLILISLLSIAYLFFFRMFIKSKLHITTKHTNVDALIGKRAIVIKRIDSNTVGQIKIEGEIWRAQSNEELLEGEGVIIKSISGVTLSVQKHT